MPRGARQPVPLFHPFVQLDHIRQDGSTCIAQDIAQSQVGLLGILLSPLSRSLSLSFCLSLVHVFAGSICRTNSISLNRSFSSRLWPHFVLCRQCQSLSSSVGDICPSVTRFSIRTVLYRLHALSSLCVRSKAAVLLLLNGCNSTGHVGCSVCSSGSARPPGTWGR